METMATKSRKTPHKKFHEELAKAKKDPRFKREIQDFIRASTKIYNLE